MDQIIFRTIQTLAGISPIVDAVGVFFASYLIWIMGATFVFFWYVDRKKYTWTAISAFVSALLAWFVNQGIGELFFRARPFVELSDVHLLISKSSLEKSFPSDHAAVAFAVAMAVFMVDRRYGAVFMLMAGLVALGRVFVGVHYPSDVLVGAVVGIICGTLIHSLIHKFLHTKHCPA